MSIVRKKSLIAKIPDLIGRGTLAQRVSHIQNRLAARRGQPDKCPYPWMMQVEVTNRCNLSCIFCSRAVSEMTLGDMDPELMDRVVALSAHAQEVALFGYGEPLISRAFYQLLPRLRSASIGFFTNGLLLNQQTLDKVMNLSGRPIKYVVFSIDGATPSTYEAVRVGSNFGKVWKNLENAIRNREKKHWKPDINIEFVAMKNNVQELPSMVRMADEAGVDLLKVSHLVVWDDVLRDQSLFYHQDRLERFFTEAAEEAKGRRIKLSLPRTFSTSSGQSKNPAPACRYPWHYAMVSYEGDVRACCFAPEFTFGNLKKESFPAIWNNRRYHHLRSTVNTANCPMSCSFCEERYRSVPSPDDEKTYIKLIPRRK